VETFVLVIFTIGLIASVVLTFMVITIIICGIGMLIGEIIHTNKNHKKFSYSKCLRHQHKYHKYCSYCDYKLKENEK